MRKICFVTGTRAEYGIMSGLIKKVHDDKYCQLQIVATNMHLSPEFGLTYKEIENDGFHIDKKVEMLLSSDTDNGIVKSMGVELIGIADAIEELNPDLLVILGDRYEILQVAVTALIMKIPVAHLYGGDITEGAYDDSIRHAITKLSHLHFTSTEEHRQRIIQMGEQPNRVFYVGSLAIESINNNILMSRNELERSLGFNLLNKSMLVTFHPVTMERGTAELQINSLLQTLDKYKDYQIIFTYPNSDGGGRIIKEKIINYVSKRTNCISFASLGRLRYYSVLKYVDIMIGNSSSGLVEAPCFGIPTLNIGDRQKGRTKGDTVVNCEPTIDGISKGLKVALSSEFREQCKQCDNPYYKEETLNNIYKVIKEYPLEGLINKHFYNIK